MLPDIVLTYTQIMDFSQAQRSAHATEFMEAITVQLGPAFHSLPERAREATRTELLADASKYQQGCLTHFQRSVMRLKADKSLVPPILADTFQTCIDTLISTTSREEFDAAINTLSSDPFPTILRGWITWWQRPHIAAMIFPSFQTCDEDEGEDFRHSEVPRTSNPIETQHSLLHHATGKAYDLIPGVEALYAHMRQLRTQYDAAKRAFY